MRTRSQRTVAWTPLGRPIPSCLGPPLSGSDKPFLQPGCHAVSLNRAEVFDVRSFFGPGARFVRPSSASSSSFLSYLMLLWICCSGRLGHAVGAITQYMCNHGPIRFECMFVFVAISPSRPPPPVLPPSLLQGRLATSLPAVPLASQTRSGTAASIDQVHLCQHAAVSVHSSC
jgi:hypothetical protein